MLPILKEMQTFRTRPSYSYCVFNNSNATQYNPILSNTIQYYSIIILVRVLCCKWITFCLFVAGARAQIQEDESEDEDMRLRNDMDLSESPRSLVMSLIELCAIKSWLDNDTVRLHRMFAKRKICYGQRTAGWWASRTVWAVAGCT